MWQKAIMKELNIGFLAYDQCLGGDPPADRKKLIGSRANHRLVSNAKAIRLRSAKGPWGHAWLSQREPIKFKKQNG